MSAKTWTATVAGSPGTAGNFDTNSALADGDSVRLSSIGTGGITSGLSQTTVLAVTWDQTSGYTGSVGTEASGTNGASYLTFGVSGAQVAHIGRDAGGQTGNGSPFTAINFGSTNGAAVHIYKTGTNNGAYPPLTLKGAAVSVYAKGGVGGFCVRPGETGTLSAVNLSKTDGQTAPVFLIGAGAVIPSTMVVNAGTLYNRSTNTATLVLVGGETATKYVVESDATGAHTTITVSEKASVIYNGTGALGTVNLGPGCKFYMSGDAQSGKQVGTINADDGAEIYLDNGVNGSIAGTGGGTNRVSIVATGDLSTLKISKPAGMVLALS